ncbi:hypothetical protein JNL27_10250 [bacterium]|nr:hypothetical protein [bacterium]
MGQFLLHNLITNRPRSWWFGPLFLRHILMGSAFGYFVFHPVTMVIYLFESKDPGTTLAQVVMEVFQSILSIFHLHMFPMGIFMLIFGGILGLFYGYYERAIDGKNRQLEIKNRELEKSMQLLEEMNKRLILEEKKTEDMLLNILPRPIAERLKLNPGIIADHYQEVTVLFADIVDFTRLSMRLNPDRLVAMLDAVFSYFDSLCDRYGLEKIKTIGDAYMAVSGLPTPRADNIYAAADMAIDMREGMKAVSIQLGIPLTLRIGMCIGPVIAGIIGKKKFIYDLWGDTVNTASRMSSQGIDGTIQMSYDTFQQLDNLYAFANRGIITVKGKGEMPTYILLEKKAFY